MNRIGLTPHSAGILWYEKERGTFHPKTVTGDNVGNTKEGTDQINELFGKKLFDFPKPTSLLKFLIDTVVENNDLVVDFFAGSGSTGQAVYELNQTRNINARFILVQLNEQIEGDTEIGKNALSLGFSSIAEIAKERMRKVSRRLDAANGEIDRGFKIFKLARSNYKIWDDIKDHDISKVEKTMELFNQNPLREDWSKNKLLTEIILMEGYPLNSKVSIAKIGDNKIYTFSSELLANELLVCLDSKIYIELVEKIHLRKGTIFICLDSAVSDHDKLRLSDKGLIKTI